MFINNSLVILEQKMTLESLSRPDVSVAFQEGVKTDQTAEITNENNDAHELPVGVERISLPDGTRDWISGLELPPGYALIGGAARSVATEMLTGQEVPVRDIDVAAFTEYGPDLSLASEVSERLMPDDYTFGHGVQASQLSDYFGSRDFTMNEVAVVDGQLLVSEQAQYDLRHNIIRPTIYEHNPDQDWHLSPKLAVKTVLLQAMLEQSTGKEVTIAGVDLTSYRCDLRNNDGETWMRPFFVALGFQKALEYGEDVASAFLDKLQQYDMIRADSMQYGVDTDERLHAFADEVAGVSDFEFRGIASERLDRMRQLTTGNYSLGDLLHSVGGDEYEQYVHYQEIAQSYGGKGRQYTDESKY
jgi:hypothetical protein